MKNVLIPLWALLIVSIINLGVGVYRDIALAKQLRSLPALISETSSRAIDVRTFVEWPLQKKVASASVIARADARLVDGVHQAVIAEIIKQTPGTMFDYKVGDRFPPGDQKAEQGTKHGQGVLIFFTGPYAALQYMLFIHDDRLADDDSTPVGKVREMAAASGNR